MQSVNHDSGLNNAPQQSDTYTTALALAATAQQFCIEAGEALIMIFVGMVAPDGINVLSSQALLRQVAFPCCLSLSRPTETKHFSENVMRWSAFLSISSIHSNVSNLKCPEHI